ncbi:hypothetical protein RIF29_18598 [Crotalaria pallida]|uniref:Uncharacterized protein n=1 Tax=Crotalaria pallida TaxID=3830 RepID=A0AAN9F135_CROPI
MRKSLSRNSTGSTNTNNNNNNNKPLSSSNSLRLSSSPTQQQQSLRRLGLCSQIATAGEHASPIVFPEKHGGKLKTASSRADVTTDHGDTTKNFDHRIDIGGVGVAGGTVDEKSDLLGHVVFSGKLVLDKRKITSINNNSASSDTTKSQHAVDAKLTSKAARL